MNEILTDKIIDYLIKLENNEIISDFNEKKLRLLLDNKKEYKKINETLEEYNIFLHQVEKEEKNAFFEEIKNLIKERNELVDKIKEQIIEEKDISQNVLVEIRPGPGGDEAESFVNDLYLMYEKFAKKKRWKVEIIESKLGYKRNFSFISFLIKGDSAFKFLKNEAGVHRVKRIPETGKGKKHTSTATVVVLPEPKDKVLNISEKDIKIETYRSSGAGGQHVNTTDSAVRATYNYFANGKNEFVTATSQEGRSQHDNKKKALEVLKSRLWEKLRTEKEKKLGSLRSSMIGTAERSENFRTYNFQSDLVADKRLKIKLENRLEQIMRGDLEEICQKSIDYEVEKKINQAFKQIK